MLGTVNRFLASRNAATAIEYAMMAGLLALAAIGGATAFGNATSTMFNQEANTVNTVVSKTP